MTKEGNFTVAISDHNLDEARRRVKELSRTFRFNEVIVMLDGLIEEVNSMEIAKRFSNERKTFSLMQPILGKLSHQFEDLTEENYKRKQLRRDLKFLKEKVLEISDDFNVVIMDMEAAKVD